MTKQEKLAFRILASIYPDRRPSEIRKIIDDAMSKEERSDDIELWAVLAKEKTENETEKKEVVKERIIERHYHDYWYPYYNYCGTVTTTITCNSTDKLTGTSTEGVYSTTTNCYDDTATSVTMGNW